MFDYEKHFESLDRPRCRADDRAIDRLEQRERDALFFIGELVRDGEPVFYINVRDARGQPTGATKEFDQQWEAVGYLIRNNYV